MNENPFEIPNFTPKEVNNDTKNTFGNILREAREAAEKTLKQVATELGISEEECLEFETGKRLPQASQLKKLASAYATVDGELEGFLRRSRSINVPKKKSRTILPTDPISRSGRVGPYQRLDNRAN